MRHAGYLFIFLVAALASCSSDDGQEQRADGRKLRQLTISEVALTRATLSETTIGNKTVLAPAWVAGDKATYFNVSSFKPDVMDTGELTASSSAETSAFTGAVCCNANDYVALFYPYQAVPTQESSRGKFTISLDGQKGTLEDIARHFHYVYGVAQVTSVTDNTANATIDDMQSLLALCKFTFVDGSNKIIPVKTLTISYYDNNYSSTLGYPLTATLTPTSNVSSLTLTYPGQNIWEDQKLTVNLTSETSAGVYVALFPTVFSDYLHFTVTNSSGTYTGTAKATLKAGKYYPVTLTLSQN